MPASPPGSARTPPPAAASAPLRPPTLWQAARSPRMVGLLVLLLAAAAVCTRLGIWQLDRAEIRGAAAQAAELAEVEAADPVPIEQVLAPQQTFDGELVGRRVEVTGTYQADGQLLVTDRVLDGRTGYLVLTPLRVSSTDPDADGAVLPVVRGWVADAADAAALAVPEGEVQVVAYLQASEDSGAVPTGDGTTDSISSAELLGQWGGPIWTGYGVLASSDPAQSTDLALLDPPSRDSSGLNIQNLGYAVQWWVFGGFAVLLWVRLLRDEVLRWTPPTPAAAQPDEGVAAGE